MIENLLDLSSLVWIISPIFWCVVATRNIRDSINLANQIILDVGLLGVLIGLVGIFKNANGSTQFIPLIQVVFLPFLYALILKGPLYLLAENQRNPGSKPDGFLPRSIAIIGFLGITAWAMDKAAGIGAYIDALSALVFFGSLLTLAFLTQFFGNGDYKKLIRAIPAVGVVFAVLGCIKMVDFIGNGKGIGLALAILMLVLLYALLLRISCLFAMSDISEISSSEIEQITSVLVYSIFPLIGVWAILSTSGV